MRNLQFKPTRYLRTNHNPQQKHNPQTQLPSPFPGRREPRHDVLENGEHAHAFGLPRFRLDLLLYTSLNLAASLPPNTGGGIDSPVSIPLVEGTGFSCLFSMGTWSEPPRPTLGLLEKPEPLNSTGPDPLFTDATVACVAPSPKTPAVVSGAGDAALPPKVVTRVNDGDCAALPLGAGAGVH